MKAIVLAAGHGRRLGALTARVPKVLLDVGGRPLLEWTLAHLAAQGIRQVGVNLHHGADEVVRHFGDGRRFGVSIEYRREQRLLGTAGALKGFEDWIGGDESFFVFYGDVLTDHPLSSLVAQHERHRALATLLLHRRSGSNSVVELDDTGRIVTFLERPEPEVLRRHPSAWVNSGVQLLDRAVLDRIVPGVESDLPRDVYSRREASDVLAGVPLSGYRCAIDSEERLAEANAAVAEGRVHPGGPERSS